MSNGNKGTATLAAVLITLVVAGAGGYMVGQRAGQTSAKLEAQVVASVNADKITKNDLYERLVKANGAQAVAQMIDEKLVDQEAKKNNVTVTDAEIDNEIAKLRDQIGGQEQLAAAMAQYNITLDQLKEDRKFRLTVIKILGKDISADDATLQKYFDDNKPQFDKREVKARQILVNTEEEAKAIKAQIDTGADFASLAKEKSIEPGAKETGGDLGTFGPGKMIPEFEQVVFAMKAGEISQPFKTQFGWHIVQVQETKGTAPTFEAVKAQVKEAYISDQVQQKTPSWLDEIRQKAKITNTLESKPQQ